MNYIEIAKVTVSKAAYFVFRPDQSIDWHYVRNISHGLKGLCLELIKYIFAVIYLITFPLASVAVYFFHKKAIKVRQEEAKKRRQEKISRILGNKMFRSV